jgi:hypothetical protein
MDFCVFQRFVPSFFRQKGICKHLLTVADGRHRRGLLAGLAADGGVQGWWIRSHRPFGRLRSVIEAEKEQAAVPKGEIG